MDIYGPYRLYFLLQSPYMDRTNHLFLEEFLIYGPRFLNQPIYAHYWTSMPIFSQYNSYYWTSMSIIIQSTAYYWTSMAIISQSTAYYWTSMSLISWSTTIYMDPQPVCIPRWDLQAPQPHHGPPDGRPAGTDGPVAGTGGRDGQGVYILIDTCRVTCTIGPPKGIEVRDFIMKSWF